MSAEQSEVQEQHGVSNQVLLAVAWLWVGLPFIYGVYKLITTASKLFAH